MKISYILLIVILTLSSCGTMRFSKTSDFGSINDIKQLDGYYLNRANSGKGNILRCFNIHEYADFVSITSIGTDKLKLVYDNDSAKQERIFTLETKKKYFELYFSKQELIIPIIYSSISIDRIRIGKTKNGKLLIRKFVEQGGNLLLLGAGYSQKERSEFEYSTAYTSYIPVQKNGVWGYADSSGKTIIPLKYDFACIFDHNTARVRLNNKWGVINEKGEEIVPLKYDVVKIDTFYTPTVFRVYAEKKEGVIDINGNELIPVIYDYIDDQLPTDGLARIRLDDMWGFANRMKVIIPPIYLEAWYRTGSMAEVRRDGKNYFVDKDGYEYPTKGFWTMRDPVFKKRRKVKID
ncbi:MAG: WG repeat-containing protein [Verrucomicrobia bacterium]|nr:WG repeat-containing protein [Cytophagales bacterium]